MTFEALELNEHLQRAITDLGFAEPTPIQNAAIPELLRGERDFVGLAQTGTGKTGAYGLPMLHLLKRGVRTPQGLVVCPTRELCMQIAEDLRAFGRHLVGLTVTAVYGGTSLYSQMSELRQGTQIVVATPGRLLDLIRRKAVDLAAVSSVVLDEADEMLNMGFQEDITAILEEIPEEARTWLFSATMPREVRAIASRYLDDPFEVTIGERNQSASNIAHIYYLVQDSLRFSALKRLLDSDPDMYGLVFCRTRADTQAIAEALKKEGYAVDALHGDLSQGQRDSVMRQFRSRHLRLLIATDVAARGLDVDDLTHVIHYALPDDLVAYTHRSGRTARAGKSGASVVLIPPREQGRLRDLERRCQIHFVGARLPEGREVCEKKVRDYCLKLAEHTPDSATMDDFLPLAQEQLAALSKDELVARLLSQQFAELISAQRQTPDLNAQPYERKPTYGSAPRPSFNDRGRPTPYQSRPGQSTGFARFFINIGRIDKINASAIVRLICDSAGIRSSSIGDIDLKREFSFVNVDAKVAQQVRVALNGSMLDGRRIVVKDAEKEKGPRCGQA